MPPVTALGMPDQTITKTVTVISVVPSVELSSGDPILQVVFGQSVDVNPEILTRIAEQGPVGKKVGAADLVLFVKMELSPYNVGSKWELTIETTGKVSLVRHD